MGTKIEWAEESWNPVTGCTPVSEGCENCYAERFALRLAGQAGYPARPYHFKVTLHPKRLEQPLKWRKPRRIFTCSMGDLFHPDVPWEFIYDVFLVMAKASWHNYLVLTKRPENMKAWLEEHGPDYSAIENIWLGVTAENQAHADKRIPVLLEIPAAIKFVSIEPMLGPVDLTQIEYHDGDIVTSIGGCGHLPPPYDARTLDWVIVGGETGPRARPVHPDWVRDIRDQCAEAGVPFFLKQWGEWTALGPHDKRQHTTIRQGTLSWRVVWRVGKKAAGRELDGREWNEYPK